MALIPLSKLLTESRATVVAMDAGQAVSMAQLQQRVRVWCAALEQASGNRWVLYNPDPMEFAAQLLALWQMGKVACLPGDNLIATRNQLTPQVDGALGEWPEALLPAEHDAGIPNGSFRTLDPESVVVEVYTSGSTGTPQAIPKKLRQLEAELSALEAQWPAPANAVVLSTVSHQHIYGLLFRILWPLSRAIPFECGLSHYVEDLLSSARRYPALILVSSPSHLGRLPESADWHLLQGRWQRVFSSAAPLPRHDSVRAQRLLGSQVHEVYGSSETGGIAWRVQAAEDETFWQPLPGVEVREGECQKLLLRSPHLPSLQRQELPDRIEQIESGCFRLLGRLDRIVKVEGKRVSLTAMELCLKELELIAEVRVIALQRHRQETAAIIQLSDRGALVMRDFGRKALLQSCRQKLAAAFEDVVLPRRWRLVTELPYNAQGKVPVRALEALFEPQASTAVEWPRLLDMQRQEADVVSLLLHIDPELRYFDGHFPGAPILPGVVQLHWAEAYGRRYLGVTGRFHALETIKFQQLISPGQQVTLRLSYDVGKQKLTFSYRSELGTHATGRICFDAAV